MSRIKIRSRAPTTKPRAQNRVKQMTPAPQKADVKNRSFSHKNICQERRPRKNSGYFAEMDPEDLGDTWRGMCTACRVEQPDRRF